MDKQMVKLWRDPFCADGAVRLFVDPPTGDILMGGAVLYAWKGLEFSLIPAPPGSILKLQYRDITIEVGWTDDVVEAANWVEEVNRFLEGKRDAAAQNGRVAPQASAQSAIG